MGCKCYVKIPQLPWSRFMLCNCQEKKKASPGYFSLLSEVIYNKLWLNWTQQAKRAEEAVMKGGKAPPVIHHPGRKAGVQTRQRVWFPSGRARKRRVKAALNLVLTWPLTWLLWDPASPLPGEDCDWGMVCPWLFPHRGCRRTRGCPSWPPLFLTLMDTGQTTPG